LKKASIKVITLCLAVFLVSMCFVGCTNSTNQSADSSSASESADSSATSKEQITIGFCTQNMSMTWMQYALSGTQAEADAEGVKLIIQDANGDVDKQTSIIENFITQKVDGILTDPINVTSLTPALKEVDQAGIPVATFDRVAEGAPYLCFVGSDDVKAGAMAADYIAKKLNSKGQVIELVGQNGASPAIDRHQGFTDEIAKYPDIKVVYSQSGEFTREKGMSVMEDAINATQSQFDAVYAANDDMMLGALQAMKASNIDVSKIVTISNDGIPDALTAIKNGDLGATIQYPVELAPDAFKELVAYIQTGKDPDQKDLLIDPWYIEQDTLEKGDFYSLIQ